LGLPGLSWQFQTIIRAFLKADKLALVFDWDANKATTNLVHLDAEVAKAFNNAESVNQALRSLIKLVKVQTAHSR
jgi:hypothetical protein